MTIYNIYKKFSSSKMQERIMFVGRNDNMEKLYEYFPKEYLPEDMGGEIPESNQKEWTKKLEKISKKVRFCNRNCHF